MDQRVTRSRVAAARVSLLAGDGHAATVQFGSIEAALAAAADGDRVVLSPGIYRGQDRCIRPKKCRESPLKVAGKAVAISVGRGNAGEQQVALVVSEASEPVVTVGADGTLDASDIVFVSWTVDSVDEAPVDDPDEWEQFRGCLRVLKQGKLTLTGCHVTGSCCHGVLVDRHAEAVLAGTTVTGAPLDSQPHRALFREAGLVATSPALPLLLHGIAVANGGRLVASAATSVTACVWPALQIFGTAALTDVAVYDTGASGVHVDGAAAVAEVTRCRIVDCGDSGIIIEKGNATVAASTLADCNRYGLISVNAARVNVRGSTFGGNSEAGVLVAFGGGHFEDCIIERSGRLSGNGIEAIGTRALLFVRCTVTDSKSHGVELSRNAVATFNDCVIKNNGTAGVRASEGAAPFITASRVEGNGKDGLVFFKNAKGRVTDTVIADNQGAGVRIESGADPTVTDCRLANNKSFGVYSVSAGGTVKGCMIVASASTAALSAGFDSTLTADSNRVSGPAKPTAVSKNAAASCRLTNNMTVAVDS